VECPITDREALLSLWNSKFPKDLYDSYKTLGSYGIGLNDWGGQSVTDKCCFATTIGRETICAMIEVEKCGPVNVPRAMAGVLQVAIGFVPAIREDKSLVRRVDAAGKVKLALDISPEHIVTMLGTEKGRELLEWMKMTADMRDELILANKTLSDIFKMAATAGQIKRMVPDLLQYLPAKQRQAFEEQKRASSLPFEWAPYPKKNVDGMLLQINKGHLLSGMGKPKNADTSVEYIDYDTWSCHAQWVD